jgi:hypothetical protein
MDCTAAGSASSGASDFWFRGGMGGANLQVGIEDLVGGSVDAAAPLHRRRPCVVEVIW